jgi:hypothetical protein
MEDDAIQVDVSRQEIMEEMMAERAGTAPEPEQPTEEQEVEEQPEAEEQPAEEEEGIDFYTQDGRTIRVPKSARYKAKLDGEEAEVDIDRVTRSYQKGAAADKRLEEAARRAKELEQYERTLAQRLQEVRQQEAAAKRPPRERGDLKAQAQKLYSAVLDEVDDPVAAIAEALAGLSPDEDEIARVVEERTLAKTSNLLSERERRAAELAAETKRNAANQWFVDNYADIVEDEHLLGRAMQMGAERLKANPNGDYQEMVRSIGDELRKWSGKTLSQQTRTKPKPTIPTPRSGQVPKKPEPKPQTRADILAEMKSWRGQPT